MGIYLNLGSRLVNYGESPMRFSIIPRTLMFSALFAALIDYYLTEVGYVRLDYLLENNPYIIILARSLGPHLASTAVLAITLALVGISYRFAVAGTLRSEPYNGTLRDVLRYLTRSSNVRIHDLVLYSTLAMYGIFIHLHLSAAIRWLALLQGTSLLPF